MAETTVSIHFGAGVDTKTDPKMLDTPKLTLLQDYVFTNTKRLSKRPGYDLITNALVGGGTWSNPTLARSYRSELVLAATTSSGQRLLSYSESLSAWADRGKYSSVAVSKQEIASRVPNGPFPFGGTVNSSCAVSGNIQLYSYSFGSNIEIAVLDSTTGMHLETASNYILTTNGTKPRSLLIGASTLGVLYVDGSSNLILKTVTVTALGGLVIGAPITLGASVISYDAETTSTGAVISYSDSIAGGTLHTKTIDTSGAVTHSVTIATVGTAVPISVNVDSNGAIWVYWADDTTPANEPLFYAVYTSTLSVTLAKTSIAIALSNVTQISALSTSSTQQTVYYSVYGGVTDPFQGITPVINSVTVTSAGVIGSPAVFLNNVDIYSKILTFNSAHYMAVMFVSDLTPTGFLIDLSDGKPVAKFLPDQADGINGSGTATITRQAGFIGNLIALSGTKILLGTEIVTTLVTQTNTTTTGSVTTTLFGIMSTVGITFDFNHLDAFQGIIQQDTLALNGGLVAMYDGANVCELGFSCDPEIDAATSGAGGVLGVGNWLYYATYEWTDANGNLHQSAPSVPFRVVFAAGAANKVTVSIKNLTMTQKTGVNIVLWRTISTGTIAYRVGSIANAPTTTLSTIIDDSTTDAAIQVNQPLYTAGGAVLENIAPPPSMIMWANNNRLWCIDSENPETTIEYSKTASSGSGIAFSTGFLELVIDSKGGAMSGASPMDEKTVIFKDRGIGYFIGDGANDAGSGSTITNFQFIPSDTGCSNSKSVISFPDGVLFRASNNKGIYLITRGVGIKYFGYDVAAYATQDIQAAQILGDRNQIRFLTSSGSSLLYDYVMQQWSVLTNHTGLSSDLFNGVYVYVRTDGSLYEENQTGTYLDNGTAITPAAQLSWIKASSIQGYQRTRRIALLGDFKTANTGHGVQVSIAYDFQPSFSAPVAFYFGGSDGAFQYRQRLDRQKCDSFQLLIQEITTGASGEYLDLSDLGIEIMTKTGLNKLPGSSSVG